MCPVRNKDCKNMSEQPNAIITIDGSCYEIKIVDPDPFTLKSERNTITSKIYGKIPDGFVPQSLTIKTDPKDQSLKSVFKNLFEKDTQKDITLEWKQNGQKYMLPKCQVFSFESSESDNPLVYDDLPWTIILEYETFYNIYESDI